MKKQTEPVDFGTPELGRRLSVVPRLTRGAFGYNGMVTDETEIDRLLLQNLITAAEHSTLEALLRRLHKASFVGLKSPGYDTIISADPSIVADKKAQTIRAMVRITERMDEHKKIGRAKRTALVNLVLLDTPWPYEEDAKGQPTSTLKATIAALNEVFARR